MAIKDLQARQGNVELIAKITDIGEPKEFEKFGKTGRVASATIKDDTGTIKLSLWNEQIDTVKVGDKVHIRKGYVNEFKGELQLTTGKFGTLDVVESAGEMTEESKGDGKPADNLSTFVSKDKSTDSDVVETKTETAPNVKESVTSDEPEEVEIEEEKM